MKKVIKKHWALIGFIGEAEPGNEPFPWLATWTEGVTVRQATIQDACCS